MVYNFCPKCGNKANQNPGVINCSHCGKSTYLHSFPTSSVFVVKGAKVMLIKRARPPHKGAWDIPGGFLNYAESPEDGAVRELKEETGLTVSLVSMLGIYMDEYLFQGETIPTLNVIYIGKIISGKEIASDDAAEIGWFDIKKPIPNFAFAVIDKAFKDMQKWFRENKD